MSTSIYYATKLNDLITEYIKCEPAARGSQMVGQFRRRLVNVLEERIGWNSFTNDEPSCVNPEDASSTEVAKFWAWFQTKYPKAYATRGVIARRAGASKAQPPKGVPEPAAVVVTPEALSATISSLVQKGVESALKAQLDQGVVQKGIESALKNQLDSTKNVVKSELKAELEADLERTTEKKARHGLAVVQNRLAAQMQEHVRNELTSVRNELLKKGEEKATDSGIKETPTEITGAAKGSTPPACKEGNTKIQRDRDDEEDQDGNKRPKTGGLTFFQAICKLAKFV